ncbi:MAG TPA: DNA cytosine methyltransferase, partial [Thermoplasmata archaeon]|nr:DNA cytosine methyltransferase [Thermoplasmata archaeon]
PKSLARYKSIPEGGNRWDMPRRLQPECWIKKTKGGTDLMGRLWWDRPAFTIRTEFFKPEKGRYLHPSEDRPITHWEAARIQTFPDSFQFLGPKIAVARQIGNAVPVVLAKAIAEAVLALLVGAEAQIDRIPIGAA